MSVEQPYPELDDLLTMMGEAGRQYRIAAQASHCGLGQTWRHGALRCFHQTRR